MIGAGLISAEDANTLVLGCMHYALLAPVIEKRTEFRVIDPGPAVATQIARVAVRERGSGSLLLATSGHPDEMHRLVGALTELEMFAPALPFPS